MVPHYAPTPNAVCAGSSLRGCPPFGFANPAPKPTVVTDGRQIDLEEALGTYKRNQLNEIKLNRHIGQRLRLKRQERGLSLPQLGKRVARSGQQIQKYETGHDAVKAAVLFQLADALNTPLLWFYEGLV
ncbi:MAG: helix-turn-helix transcriptional regulator [Acetobacter orientalis]|uniref:helix-turn-helix domain-containing protein n=1 Tax=Acetobacter orientalis TaxID=146474 RepID=UPI0039EC3F25